MFLASVRHAERRPDFRSGSRSDSRIDGRRAPCSAIRSVIRSDGRSGSRSENGVWKLRILRGKSGTRPSSFPQVEVEVGNAKRRKWRHLRGKSGTRNRGSRNVYFIISAGRQSQIESQEGHRGLPRAGGRQKSGEIDRRTPRPAGSVGGLVAPILRSSVVAISRARNNPEPTSVRGCVRLAIMPPRGASDRRRRE